MGILPAHTGSAQNTQSRQTNQYPTWEVTVGVFFDGTLNNRNNTSARITNNRVYQRHQEETRESFRQSYENDYSNIARMEPVYRWIIDKDRYQMQFAIYIEGIGTVDNRRDYFWGGATGRGESAGVHSKVIRACRGIARRIHNLGIHRINTLSIDTFGFSRGAAAARNFIYEISRRQESRYSYAHGSLGFWLAYHEIVLGRIDVRFVGLYETVASYGIFYDNNTSQLNLDSVRSARHTFQLVAADEHRENFQLTNISSCGRNGVEKTIPGVHSDIGGGYLDRWSEEVYLLRSNFGARNRSQINSERINLIEQGWYTPGEIRLDHHYHLIGRRNLDNRYSFIPLEIMIRYGMSKNLNFDLASATRDYFNLVSQNSFLNIIRARLINYAFNRSSEISFNNLRDRDNLKRLRNEFLHFSAHFNPSLMGGFPGTRYPHRPAQNRRRRTQDG